MLKNIDAVLQRLREAVKRYDFKAVEQLALIALELNLDPAMIIEKGLAEPLRELGEAFSQGDLFLPDLVAGAEAMKRGVEVLKKAFTIGSASFQFLGRIVIGTVAGDLHDLGKNIVAAMLAASGFEVIDLGRDVSTEAFVDSVKRLKPDALGLSALMTTTMLEQGKVIQALKNAGLRAGIKVVVGGAPVDHEWAERVEADGYAEDAVKAVAVFSNLLQPRCNRG